MARKRLSTFQKCVSRKLKGKRGSKATRRKAFKKAVKACALEAYYKG